jgi:hypothetical protein
VNSQSSCQSYYVLLLRPFDCYNYKKIENKIMAPENNNQSPRIPKEVNVNNVGRIGDVLNNPITQSPEAEMSEVGSDLRNIGEALLRGTEISDLKSEKMPQSQQSSSNDSIITDNTIPQPLNSVVINAQQTSVTQQTSTDDVNKDEDQIDKIWIDRAKKIIELTKGDPYSQEKAISKLQVDYIAKQFKKQMKSQS